MERDILQKEVGATILHLFDIKEIFKRRGRKVSSASDLENILFELPSSGSSETHYKRLGSSSFRRIIGLISNSQRGMDFDSILSECKDLQEKKIKNILEKGIQLKMIRQTGDVYHPSKEVGFGPTFEWYIAMVCESELGSFAYWGVEVEGLTGDYDVVVIRENQIGYIECKSGKFSNITENEVKNFLIREKILAPQFSIFLVDRISRENLEILADHALKNSSYYDFGIPGIMETTDIELEIESYKNFIRLIPINSFFVSIGRSVVSSLREIYEFLTTVCDRSLQIENLIEKNKYLP